MAFAALAATSTFGRRFASKTTDKLQRILNTAAKIVSDTRKSDRGLKQASLAGRG